MAVTSTPRPVGALSGMIAASTLVLGSLALLSAPAAVAAPGQNGDMKVHKVGTPFNDRTSDAKVCTFYLAASDFDTAQKVDWTISPSSSGQAAQPGVSGSIALASGTGHSEPQSMPDGHYELSWTSAGVAKHRKFDVACRPENAVADNNRPAAMPRGVPGESDAAAPAPGSAANGDASSGNRGQTQSGGRNGAGRGDVGNAYGGGNREGGHVNGGNVNGGNAGNGNANGGPDSNGAPSGGTQNVNGNAVDDFAGGRADRHGRAESGALNGPVDAGGGGTAQPDSLLSTGFAVAGGLAGLSGYAIVRRARRRADDAA
ncbi:hypothetical protein [Streptomyces sannanensis]